ncbi:MAG: flagellin lysine-N-methylase [Candidatus Hydrogenedentota bacterium]
MPAPEGPLIIAPAGIDYFDCTGCGRCCKLWGVQVDADSFRRARDFLENPPAPRPNPDLDWYKEEEGNIYYNLTPRGNCVFLDANHMCYLHTHDPALKSIVCRNYPREETRTPRGREVTLTFSSYGAFVNVLCRPEPFSLVRSPMTQPLPLPDASKPAISHPKSLSWKTLYLVEEALLDTIASTSQLDDALAQCAHFLSKVEGHDDGKKLRRAIQAREIHPSVRMNIPGISDLESAWKLIDRIIRFRILFLADNPMLEPDRIEVQKLIDDMQNGPGDEKIGPSLFYRRLRRSWFDPCSAEITPLLRKFILYKIFKKTFFLEYGLVRGFNIICFMYALARLQLMLMARREGRVPGQADLFEPLRFAEVHFAHSGRFLQFWKEAFKSDMLASAAITEILVRA